MKTTTKPTTARAPRFRLTYSVTTEFSAINGDFAFHGFLPRSGVVPNRINMPKTPAEFTLRRAFEIMEADARSVSADSWPCTVPRWLSIVDESDWHTDGRSVEISIHLEHLSDASARRVARLFNCKGLKP